MCEDLNEEQRARLWEHRLHVENLFYSRLTSFLTIQAILLAVVGALYSKNGPPIFILKIISILGLLLTFLWLFAQFRHKQSVDTLVNRAKECLPEYRVTMRKMEEERGGLRYSSRPLWLTTYIVPLLIAMMWVILLLFLFRWLPPWALS
jgi:hypothetical protein